MAFGSKSLTPATPDEARRIAAIRDLNTCLTCGDPGIEIHHLLMTDMRMGERFTVGLCRDCHSQVKTRAFRAEFGTEQDLLDQQDDAMDYPRVTIPKGRREARAMGTMAPAKARKRPKRGPQTQRSTKTLPRRGL